MKNKKINIILITAVLVVIVSVLTGAYIMNKNNPVSEVGNDPSITTENLGSAIVSEYREKTPEEIEEIYNKHMEQLEKDRQEGKVDDIGT